MCITFEIQDNIECYNIRIINENIIFSYTSGNEIWLLDLTLESILLHFYRKDDLDDDWYNCYYIESKGILIELISNAYPVIHDIGKIASK